ERVVFGRLSGSSRRSFRHRHINRASDSFLETAGFIYESVASAPANVFRIDYSFPSRIGHHGATQATPGNDARIAFVEGATQFAALAQHQGGVHGDACGRGCPATVARLPGRAYRGNAQPTRGAVSAVGQV